MIRICKLCKEQSKICQSHIIPEWGYDGVYDEKHRFVGYDILNQRKGKIKQKGERERLLCKECESIFSDWEAYGRRVWELEAGQWEKLPGGGLLGTNLDYQKLKLFLLSVLWRSDIATGDMGENVSLGPHSERIRLMLLDGGPEEPTLYPCMMMRIFEGTTWNKVGLRWPIKGRWDGQWAYSVAFKGIGLLYVIGKKRLKREEQRGCIDTDGNVVMGISQAKGWIGQMGDLEIGWPSESVIQESMSGRYLGEMGEYR